MIAEPTISDFLDTAKKAGAVADGVADYNRGSDYESLSGPNAIIWSRQTQRDTDLWRQTRFHDAQGEQLTDLVSKRFGIDRVLDTYGEGMAILVRATASAGGGTVWDGTRIRVQAGPLGVPIYYRVVGDNSVSSGALTRGVPIEAVAIGPGSKISTSTQCSVDDPLWDSTWTVASVTCSDGTVLEPAADFRERVRTTRRSARVGQEQGIINACYAVGAQVVALFRSDYKGDGADVGLNFAYVGDLGYSASTNLVRACTLALRSSRVAGDNMQVLPLSRTVLSVDVDVYLRDDPGVMPVDRLAMIHRKALIQYMNGPGGRFTYTIGGLESAIARTGTEVQDIVFVTPSADAGVALGAGSLPRFFLDDSTIVIRYHGPNS